MTFGFEGNFRRPPVQRLLEAPASPEGYVYYGLFPQAVIGRARGLGVAAPGTRVIGLRSIGGLAPVMAAAVTPPAAFRA